jgi:hypothetical protein
MASHTLTSTAFGELRVTHTPDAQELRSVCKRCHEVTEQTLALDLNPFTHVRPNHKPTCRFVTDAEGSTPLAAPPSPGLHATPAVVLPSGSAFQVTWVVVLAVLVALMIVAGVVGHLL